MELQAKLPTGVQLTCRSTTGLIELRHCRYGKCQVESNSGTESGDNIGVATGLRCLVVVGGTAALVVRGDSGEDVLLVLVEQTVALEELEEAAGSERCAYRDRSACGAQLCGLTCFAFWIFGGLALDTESSVNSPNHLQLRNSGRILFRASNHRN